MTNKIQEEIVSAILAKMDAGVIPWRKPWAGGVANMPRNGMTKRHYSGVNVFLLWAEAEEKGYSKNDWLTYKQAQAMGGQVRKGEKSSKIVWCGPFEIQDDKTGEDKTIFTMKWFSVFNVAQIDGLDIEQQATFQNDGERDAMAEAFVSATGADVRHNEQRAYYTTKGDYINLPAFASFVSVPEYYSTAFHELTHWTGAEHRMNREFGKRFGDRAYSVEELTAELGSAFLCAEFGFANDTLDNSAAYLEGWRNVIRADGKIFMAAASAASKAVEYMREKVNAAKIAPEMLQAAE